MYGRELDAERAFWTCEGISWEWVNEVDPWCRYSTYWTRKVHYKRNAWGGGLPHSTVWVEFEEDHAMYGTVKAAYVA